MENVIEAIHEIDKLAFEREEKNKSILEKEKNAYEDEIAKYREEQMKAAYARSENLYENEIKSAKAIAAERQAAGEREIAELKERFREIEAPVIDSIFAGLFTPEER